MTFDYDQRIIDAVCQWGFGIGIARDGLVILCPTCTARGEKNDEVAVLDDFVQCQRCENTSKVWHPAPLPRKRRTWRNR
jgi:hypothetical protein